MPVEILIAKKNVIMDATLLSTLMSCARYYDLRMNHDLESISGRSSSVEMGSVCHTILECYYKSIVAGKSKQDAIEEGFKAGNKYAEEETQNISEEDRQLAIDTMQQYFEHYKNDFWIPVDVEHVKQAQIYEDDEVRIIWKAKFDLTVDTNNGIYPVDHKTMRQRRDTLSLNNQFMGQCILLKTRSVIINKIGFQKSLKPSEKFTRPMISYSLARLVEQVNITIPFWTKQLIAYDEIGYYPPNYTHCENKYGICAFKSVCESNPDMREEELRLHFIKGKHWDVSND